MESWMKVTIVLCIFGFLKEVRPIESFIYAYLTEPSWWNLTSEQVQQDIFPISMYSHLGLLVVIFLFTDLCRYKPFITLLGVCGAGAFSFILWGNSILHLVILEVLYGTMFATEVAYYTYIYAKVSKESYAQVTSYVRAAVLAGRCLSAILAQVLTQLEWMNYRDLNYITVSALVAAAIWSLFLPSLQTSTYFHRDGEKEQPIRKQKYRKAFILMKSHFIQSFSKQYVIKWSVWWTLATCGYMQVMTYSQPLWSLINEDTNAQLHNGTVDAASTLVSCLGALSVGFIKVDWKKYGEVVISTSSIICGLLLLICSHSQSIIVAYICYIIFCGIYHSMITIGTSEVSKYILEDSYGLVFGLNTFIALSVQTIVVVVLITGDVAWKLPPREQHLAYGFYYIGIAFIFILWSLFKCVFYRRNESSN